MRRATALSINTYFIQLIQRVGPANVVAMAHKLGITSDLQPYVSLALGTEEVSPFELTSAYATIANQGVYCKPFAITQVIDSSGRVIANNDPACKRVVAASVPAQGGSLLVRVAEPGAGRRDGQDHPDAQKPLEAPGLSATVTLAKSPKPQGTLLTETPKAGETVEEGTMITLTASGNPTPAPSPQPAPSGAAPPASPSPTKKA